MRVVSLTARVVLATVLAVAVGCGGEEIPPDPHASHPGRALYFTHCVACHGRQGAGAKNLFPPLAGSPWVQGPAEVPIRVVIHGMQGRLTVNGEEFLNLMPGLGDRLSDRQIADVLSYVRVSFGNDAPAVTEAQVTAVREATRDQETMYHVEEMEAFRARLAAADTSGGSP